MKSIRARWLLLAATALTVIGTAVIPSYAAAESAETTSVASPLAGCSPNVVCIYAGSNYTSPYYDAYCSSGGRVWNGGNTYMYSVRNRCGNKTAWIRRDEIATYCLPPGGEQAYPGWFNELVISSEYGNKC